MSALSPFLKKTDVFAVRCFGEHVKRLYIRRLIADRSAALVKPLQIAGECRGIATHIDDTLRRHAQHGIDELRRAALARRIEHHDVRMRTWRLLVKAAADNEVLRGTRIKMRIFYAVPLCIFL